MAQTVSDIEWRISDALVPYEEAVAAMEARVAAIRAGARARAGLAPGASAALHRRHQRAPEATCSRPISCPVFRTGRGGQYTYHGPGQRVGYVMLDLQKRGADLRAYVRDLEEWLIRTLQRFNVKGERRAGRVGIWVAEGGGKESKIAAIGVRIRHWVSFHGVSLNVDPDLAHYRGIVPCGISEHGVTSLAALGITATMPEVDAALKAAFAEVFAADCVSDRLRLADHHNAGIRALCEPRTCCRMFDAMNALLSLPWRGPDGVTRLPGL